MADMTPPPLLESQPPAGPPNPAIPWGWLRGLLFFPVFLILLFVGSVVTAIVMQARSMEDFMRDMDTPMAAVGQAVMLGLIFAGVWLFRKFIDRRSLRSMGLAFEREHRRDFLVGILWGIGLVAVVFVGLLITRQIEIVSVRFPVRTVVVMLIVLALAAFQEELVIRGYMLTNFMQSMNRYLALGFSAVLFALLHGSNPNVDLVALANIVLAGLVLGIYFVHRGNLWLPFGLHLGWNYFQGVVFGSRVSGIDIPSILQLNITGDPLWTGGEFGFESSLLTTFVIALATVVQHVVYRRKSQLGVPGRHFKCESDGGQSE